MSHAAPLKHGNYYLNKWYFLHKINLNISLLFFVMLPFIFSHLNGPLLSIFFISDDPYTPKAAFSFEFFAGVLFILASVYWHLTSRIITRRSRHISQPSFYFYTALLLMIISIFINSKDIRPILSVLSLLGYFLAARYFARYYLPQIASNARYGFPFIVMIFSILIIYFYYTDQITFRTEIDVGVTRPGEVGGLRSSEVAMFIGLQIFYIQYIYNIALSRTKKLFLIIILGIQIIFLVFFVSVGAIIALIAVVVIMQHANINKAYFKTFLYKQMFLVTIIIAISISSLFFIKNAIYLNVISTKITEKFEDAFMESGLRALKYQALWKHIQENPLIGIGFGNFVKSNNLTRTGEGSYPHSVILGLAAENGIFCSMFYILFAVGIFLTGWKVLRQQSRLLTDKRLIFIKAFLTLAVSCFLFLEFRSLFHESWQNKEIYLWAGIIVGIKEWFMINGRNVKITGINY